MIDPFANTEARRVLGSYSTGSPGPLFFVVGGIHGNEPAGVVAALRVLAVLERQAPPLRGRLLCLTGNMNALLQGKRYIDEDLNRLWNRRNILAMRSRDRSEDNSEQSEQRQLLELVEEEMAEQDWELIALLDMHSTSADGSPFSIMADTIQNRSLAFALPVPVLLGLEESVDGTLLAHVGGLGHVAVCLEGGQNDLDSTVDHHEAAIWRSLVSLGLLDQGDVPPDYEAMGSELKSTAWGLPEVVEVIHHEEIPRGHHFEMSPGYTNFHIVEQGEHLADCGPPGDQRPVCSPSEGLLLMPRYQGQGEDGFFLGKEVRPIWLRLSALCRRLRLGELLPFLPGVSRKTNDGNTLACNLRLARILPVQVFHLCGFRRVCLEGNTMVFVRRPDRF